MGAALTRGEECLHGRGRRPETTVVTTERVGTADIDDDVLPELVTNSDVSDSEGDEVSMATRRRG